MLGSSLGFSVELLSVSVLVVFDSEFESDETIAVGKIEVGKVLSPKLVLVNITYCYLQDL